MNYLPRPTRTYYGGHEDRNKFFVSVDQEKSNLLWLVFPEMEDGLDALPDGVCEHVNSYFDVHIRAALKKPPLEFVEYLTSLDYMNMTLCKVFPPNWYATMCQRAAEANARLLGIEREGNVVRVNFRRTA